METLLIDLEALPPTSWCVTEHDALLASPRAELERLLEFLGVDLSYPAVRAVGLAMHRQPSGSEPRAAQDALGPYVRRTEQLAARARDWIAKVPDSGENT
jgi:hypothetical protein